MTWSLASTKEIHHPTGSDRTGGINRGIHHLKHPQAMATKNAPFGNMSFAFFEYFLYISLCFSVGYIIDLLKHIF